MEQKRRYLIYYSEKLEIWGVFRNFVLILCLPKCETIFLVRKRVIKYFLEIASENFDLQEKTVLKPLLSLKIFQRLKKWLKHMKILSSNF